jgi:hypothetical protein
MRRLVASLAATLGAVLVLAAALPAQAQRAGASEASAVSMLPLAVLASTPTLLLSGAGMLTVVAVEASADGVLWVLQRASDGARLSMQVAGGASVVVGQALRVTALATGWVLSAAGEAVAFVPNSVGLALLYQERVTR